jgi:site-specific DNA-methyltransferase (adenine-specific)
MMIDLRKGDCLEVMKTIESGSIDAIITDPPYGTTACKWDSVIDFKLMWEQLNRIIKPNGAIVLFGSEPFSSALRMSNIKNYKYDWIWDKKKAGNFASVRYQPLKPFEIVSIFNKHNYYPQMTKGKMRKKGGYNTKHEVSTVAGLDANVNDLYYPKAIIEYTKANNIDSKLHPTQKPVALMEYLIKTYTNENETVLDFTMGSGTTGVAAKNLNRNFIGIEMDAKYFDIATERIKETELKLF